MPDAAPLIIPGDLLVRIIEEHAESQAVLAEVRRELGEAQAAYATIQPHLRRLEQLEAARVEVRAQADAQRLEGRSGFVKLATSGPALVIYGAIVSAIATLIMGASGVAPGVVRTALQEPTTTAGSP